MVTPTDGYVGYLDTDFFGGYHDRNMRDKSDTHTVESINKVGEKPFSVVDFL